MTKLAVRKCNRSGSEECPICNRPAILVEHHIHGREIPDAEAAWNKAWVCASCHDLIHAGEIFIEGWFSTTAGRELFWRKKGEFPKLKATIAPHLYGAH